MSEVKVEVLEERVKHLEDLLERHIEEDAVRLASIERKLDILMSFVAKYKGFVGGLLFAASAVGAVITYLITYFGRG